MYINGQRIVNMPASDEDPEVLNPLIPKSDIKWLPPLTPKERVIEKIQTMHFRPGKDKEATVEKFWNAFLEDLDAYDMQLKDPLPFEHSCYKYCSPVCIRRWDKTYWEYKVAGFRKRTYVSQYKFPTKLLSVALIFVGGLLRLIRANQDGKASFYANIIHVITNLVISVIFWLDGERVMLLPKLGAIVVSIAILNGILQHAEEGGVGL